MAYSEILRDEQGNPIPQIWDEATNDFVPYRVMTYYGNSTDAKPTVTTVGVRFVELDTKKVFVWNGITWGEF